MNGTFSVIGLLLLVGCTTSGSTSGPPGAGAFDIGPLSGKYTGNDAGYLVVTIAAQTGTLYDDYFLYLRKKDRSAKGEIWWGQENPFDRRKLDIEDDKEEGIVDVRRLPPGDYEIFNVQAHINAGTRQIRWESKSDFSIPFEITAGRATYIGEMMVVGLKGDKGFLGLRSPEGAVFVLTDKSTRDIPIAKAKEPRIGEVAIKLVDPNSLANPAITNGAH